MPIGYPVGRMIGKTSVFLVGPMGSGKTAVGRHLARVLRLPFHDSDAEIERRTGVDIPFLGHLFKNTSHQDNKDELMIFITPKIVHEGVSVYN